MLTACMSARTAAARVNQRSTAAKSIPFGSPHVRHMVVHRACGKPNEIKTAPTLHFTLPLSFAHMPPPHTRIMFYTEEQQNEEV